MSDEQTTTNNEFQFRTIGFITNTTKEEQKKQKSRIKKFYDDEGYVPDNGPEYSPDWDKINNDLERGDYIIIDDLTDLARNREDLVARLLAPAIKGIRVKTVNEAQRESLNWGEILKHLENLISSGGGIRVLECLQKLVKQIFPDTEKNNEKQ